MERYVRNVDLDEFEGEIFVAGYESPPSDEPGFVDRLTDSGWVPFSTRFEELSSLWVAGRSSVFAAYGQQVLLTDGDSTQTWTFEGAHINGIFGFGSEDVLAVGNAGTVLRFDGESWVAESSGTDADLRGVWGAEPGETFAVGEAGTIIRTGELGWEVMPTPTEVPLNVIWGSASDDVYAVGGDGAIPGHVVLHFDGVEWRAVHLGDARRSVVASVRGRSPSDISAVGAWRDDASDASHPLFLHFDGVTWSEVNIDTPGGLSDVCPLGTDAYVVAGAWDILGLVRF